ncbi:MAG: hypothetical protein WKF73_13005 [Nocardioidaceae bacterium]
MGAGLVWASRRWNWAGNTAMVGVITVVLGLGLTRAGAALVDFADPPWPGPARARSPDIGTGGIDAARWLRDHSSPDELVATNAHCRDKVESGSGCDARHFWVSGYSERHVLVEGWAYIAPGTVGEPSNAVTNSSRAPFWDPQLLNRNDQAFGRPTAAALGVLREDYGVRWLFVDLSQPVPLAVSSRVRLGRLSELADVVYRQGGYVVLDLG